jgi:metallophosphoesterase superfamily enzyme
VSIPCTEYEHVREAVDRRVVIAGHEHSAGVVTRGGGYIVVSD